MVNQKSIDHFSWLYAFYKPFVRMFFRIYYRRIQVVGRENVTLERPLLLAPNHQNALMDAIAILSTLPYQPVFYARSDIFNKPLIIRILTFLKIMPIYRIRDGISNVKRNDEMFEKGLTVLENRIAPLTIMPEGNHGDKRRLRPLVKGIFRLAFAAQEKYGNAPGVRIVPVGIDWGHYINFRSDVLIQYGHPIEVSEYFDRYKANPAEGINALKERLEREMSAIMIDIRPLEAYDTIERIRSLVTPELLAQTGAGRTLAERLIASRQVVKGLNQAVADNRLPQELPEAVDTYYKQLSRHRLRDHSVRRAPYSILALLLKIVLFTVLLPVHLFGVVTNYLPYSLPVLYARKIKDTQFRSSFKFVLGIVFFLVWYGLLAIVVGLIPIECPAKWAAYALAPFAGVFAIEYYLFGKKLVSQLRMTVFRWFTPRVFNQLKQLRRQIVEQTLKTV